MGVHRWRHIYNYPRRFWYCKRIENSTHFETRQSWIFGRKENQRFGQKTLWIHKFRNLTSSWKNHWKRNYRWWRRAWEERGRGSRDQRGERRKIKGQKEKKSQRSSHWIRNSKQKQTYLDEKTWDRYKRGVFRFL